MTPRCSLRFAARGAGPAVAALVVLVGASACTGNSKPDVAQTETPPASPSAAQSSTPPPSGMMSPSASQPAPMPPTPQQLPAIDPATLQQFYTQKLNWTACAGNLQCSKLRVPLDYEKPDGTTLELAVIRLRTTASNRIGSVVINPGGPGGSGVDYVKRAGARFDAELQHRFDVVSFDPRGVGQSSPVQCATTALEDKFVSYDADPADPAEVAEFARINASFANGCKEMSGQLLAHVGTPDTARDLDVLRAALGEDRLTYIGESYGTFLGAIYAQLFPSHVRALVLDGAVDPSLDDVELGEGQARGFELALRSFIANCVKDSGCPVGQSASGAESKLGAWLDGLEAHPLPAADGREVTRALAVTGIAAALYNPRSWPALRAALTDAMNSQPALLLRLADALSGRGPDGQYNNLLEANVAINCADRPAASATIAEAARAALASSDIGRVFGEQLSWGNPACIGWPAPAQLRPGPVRAAGAPPIVVIGTLRDPATPVAWARSLAAQLESGVLVTWDGDGHTANLRGSACVDGIVRAYVVSLVVPDDGTACGPV